MFSVQHKGFWFQNKELKKTKKVKSFGQKGLQQNGFFLSTSVLKMSKVIVFFFFFAIFWQFLVDVQKTL